MGNHVEPLVWHCEKRKVNDLIPWERNPRQMTAKQAADLEQSIKNLNLIEIPAIDTDETLVGGHKRCMILQLLGRGEEEIDVRVPNRKLTEEEFIEANLRLNKNTGEWNLDLLASFPEDLLKGVGFTDEELSSMFQLDMGGPEPAKGEDDIPEPPAEPITKPGDIYTLGNHRLICGSATSKNDIERLMNTEKANLVFTDPPYDFKDDFLFNAFNFISEGNIFVMDGDKNHARNCAAYIERFIDFYVLFFKAPTWNLSKKIPLTQHVLIAHYRTENAKIRDLDMLHSVIETSTKNDKSIKEYVAKRQEAIQPFIKNFSDKGDIVLDLFGGTGSILIACEQLGRRAYLCEIDPLSCDVIIERWEKFTNQKALIVHE